jgi:hypothetical protein
VFLTKRRNYKGPLIMALLKCPDCNNDISDKAVICPHCGAVGQGFFRAFEYRSKKTLFGLPLVHIVWGPAFDPVTGRMRIAKGIIAIGGISVGVLAIGGVAFGAIALGGVAVGLAALGGVALGMILAIGGLAVGFVALGGAAIGYYAVGGGACGIHTLSGNAGDTRVLEFFKTHFGR